MKKICIGIFIALFVVFLIVAVVLYNMLSSNYTEKSPAGENRGETLEQAPLDFKVYNGNGDEVLFSSFKGKPVIINFWATWCGVCTTEFPHFENAYKKYGDNVQFMMVNMTEGSYETEEKAKSFIEKNGYTFPVYYDKDLEASVKYYISAIPVTVFIDEDRNIVAKRIGGMNEQMLSGYIENLIGE